jgi:transcription initiation factor TFIIF subunit beta
MAALAIPTIKTENAQEVSDGKTNLSSRELAQDDGDDDIYEDAGDLDFTDATQDIYLARIPKFVWKAWSELEDNREICIGTIRVEGGLEKPQRVVHASRRLRWRADPGR